MLTIWKLQAYSEDKLSFCSGEKYLIPKLEVFIVHEKLQISFDS